MTQYGLGSRAGMRSAAESERRILELTERHGLDAAAIAERLGLRPAIVRQLLARARDKRSEASLGRAGEARGKHGESIRPEP